MIELTLFRQTIKLLPERAAYWVEKKLLIVADIHLGKVAAMQKAGIPVPEGAMEEDLSELARLIEQTGAKKCVIVGDLIHAKNAAVGWVSENFSMWLKKPACQIDLVFGNHDKSLIKHLPSDWALSVHYEQLKIEPFCFSHIPTVVEGYFVWSGHLHPQIVLSNGSDRVTLRCFQIYDAQGILPAFSTFVGGFTIKKEKKSRVFVTTGQEVIEV